ncbi:uncharacterized protein LOC142219916 [Haematobia irritans]|uniref:uncharacterized protein LOC142219916 n=1 Tax=Haematobia irritans TaxID=7368 RepID=UPI003F508958
MRISTNFLIAISIVVIFGQFHGFLNVFSVNAQDDDMDEPFANRQNNNQRAGGIQKAGMAQANTMTHNNAQKAGANQNNSQKMGANKNNDQKSGTAQKNAQKAGANNNNAGEAQKMGTNKNNAQNSGGGQKMGANQNNAQKPAMSQNNGKNTNGSQNNAQKNTQNKKPAQNGAFAQTNAQKVLLNQINRQIKRGLAQIKQLQKQVQKNIKRPVYNANKSTQFAKPKKPQAKRQQNFAKIYKRLDKKPKVISEDNPEGEDVNVDDDEDDEEELEAINDDFDGRSIVAPGEYPHMGALGFPAADDLVEFKCGGSLISPTYVITAAHCCYVIGDSPVLVKFGIINLKEENSNPEMPQTRNVAEVIVHPLYNTSMHYHDIALLRLDEPIVYSPYVRPVRLWARDDIPYPNVFTMGYGSTSFAKAPTYILTEMELSTVPHDECNEELPPNEIAPQGITDTQICAKDYIKNRDTCQGDSGGPLQLNLQRRRNRRGFRYYLVGIISYGEVCGSGSPGVYTRVSSYIDWIASIVWPEEFQNF